MRKDEDEKQDCFPIVENEHCKVCQNCGRKYNWLASKSCYRCTSVEESLRDKLSEMNTELILLREKFEKLQAINDEVSGVIKKV